MPVDAGDLEDNPETPVSIQQSEWHGLIAGKRSGPDRYVTLRATLEAWHSGVSGAFKGVGSDNKVWWVKPPGQPNLGKALVTEYVVGAVGRLISAPTCNTSIISIPSTFAGWHYRGNDVLIEGYGHATEHVEDAIEERQQLKYRSDDDNHRRHAGVFALHDWCYGSDQQWLHSTTNNMTIYSHDHGWYLPPTGPNWTSQDLIAAADTPNPLSQDSAGVDPGAFATAAEALESIARTDLVDMLTQVPTDWPVTDEELETLGWFLEYRAPIVAERIKALI